MTPYEFLRRYDREDYNSDPRLVEGGFFPSSKLGVESGDTVGVVLLNLGGPDGEESVEPFLYNLFMDPAIIDFSEVVYFQARGLVRHWFSRIISYFRSMSVAEDYKEISDDGGSPINPLTREQAENLEHQLNERYAARTGATFKTYMAMRYWEPFSEQTAAQMQEDGVDRVVLLPLYPQYSKTTTGASLVYWHELEKAGEIPAWPTTSVFEYATYPKYIEALSDRIDEGLERFPEEVRDDVHLLFSAHGTPLKEMEERRDPYCCLVHSTVKHLMEHRDFDHSFNTAFQSKVGPSEWLTPATDEEVERLAEEGKDVLVIPVAFVTDHIETSYELAIEIPEELEEEGAPIPEHYEVMPGLNSHPKFIETLADMTAAQLQLPDVKTPTPGSERPCCKSRNRDIRCHQCERVAEATDWTAEPEREPELA
ncbi:MAG: ferrochelatase [Salinibacter sp.]|uniref:ferrochelatase n=1 Tax=Salinibacter sp. TaxID=2065818 RepID=UPI0035D4AE02